MPRIITDNFGAPLITNLGQKLLAREQLSADDIQIFHFHANLLQAILWEYNDAANLQSLLNQKSAWYQQNYSQFWQSWIKNVFDLRTANAFGLAVWAIIMGFTPFVNTPPDYTDKPVFGFDNPFFSNFDNSNFSSVSGSSQILPLETQRIALRLRYYQLTGSCTVPEINRILADVFEEYGKAVVIDLHNMTQQYVFYFPITSDLAYLFDNYDILPRAAGVQSFFYDGTVPHFGFGPFGLNFDNGNFGE